MSESKGLRSSGFCLAALCIGGVGLALRYRAHSPPLALAPATARAA